MNGNGAPLADTALIGTGCKIQLLDANGAVVSEVTVVISGDLDGDGIIKSSDALTALRVSVGLDQLDGAYLLASDVDGKEGTSSSDALKILRYSVGLEKTLK